MSNTCYFATVKHASGKTLLFGPYAQRLDLDVELETYSRAYYGFRGLDMDTPKLEITHMQAADHILGQHAEDWYHSEVLQGRRYR